MDPPSYTQTTALSSDNFGAAEEDRHRHHEAEEAAVGDNVLQKHVAFFDRNNDGIVYPWETFQGFRAIGCGWALSGMAALLINTALSQKTRPGKCPSLLFPIEVKNINRSKHTSDSGVYDAEGRFVPGKFEEIFKRHAKTHGDALSWEELYAMLKSNRQPGDYGGWFKSWTEWRILYKLCKDGKGLLQKETIRGVYDGSLFERMQEERSKHPNEDLGELVQNHGDSCHTDK